MRKNEGDEVEGVFGSNGQFDLNFIRVNAQERYYNKLAGVTDPEAKRKIIGEEFIRIFEEEAKKMIRSVDEARDNYHMHYAGFLPSDPKHKTIMIDSSSLGVEGTAEYLVDFIQKKFDLKTYTLD